MTLESLLQHADISKPFVELTVVLKANVQRQPRANFTCQMSLLLGHGDADASDTVMPTPSIL